MTKILAKILRVVSIVLMGLTAVLTLLGGVGTVCVAWAAEKWASLAALVPYKPVYQVATIITLIAALAGIRVTYGLLRGEKWSYVGALVTLLVGLGTAGTKMYFSSMLRGSTAPTNFRFYFTTFTLLVFLLLRLPGIWKWVGFTDSSGGPGSPATPAGLALLLGGVLTLTTPIWAGPTHTIDGYNLVNVLQLPLMVGGGGMVLAGATLLILAGWGTSVSALFRRSVQAVGRLAFS